MSAIAGVCYLDGRKALIADLRRMLHRLAHRGPDGEGAWGDGAVALGHRMLHTTEESLAEALPLANRAGTTVLTADARIDNREELIRKLGLTGRSRREMSDSELILSAYERWGEECPLHLVGDFAFAIWDAKRKRIFCARDPFGVKPFYYHHQAGRLFVFASEIKGLLAIAEVPHRLDETRVGDFLQWFFDDEEITFFEGIHRLPPAHALVVASDGKTLRRYWSLDPGREVRCGSDEEYAEAFREIFLEAVRCRMRGVLPIGASLSGGLDSSSIVCAARRITRESATPRLHTFSIVFDQLARCDERPFIEAVLAGGGVVPHFIQGDALSPLEDLDDYLRHEDEAPWVFNMCLHWGLHRAAAAEGVRVFLDGLGGDEVVGHGIYRLAELARTGRLIELAISAARLGRHFGRSPFTIVRRHAIRPLLPRSVVRRWDQVRGRPSLHGTSIRPLVAGGFAERIGMAERLALSNERRATAPNSARGAHYLGLRSGITSAGFESIDRVAAAFAIEPRYPFQDRRLVEFCLGLPTDQKFRRGWTRVVLRNAMKGLLPEDVRLRGGKGDLTAQFTEGFLRFERERIEAVVFDRHAEIAAYVDVARLRDLYREYVDGRWQNATLLWHPVVLAIWLQRARFSDPPGTGGGPLSGSYPSARTRRAYEC